MGCTGSTNAIPSDTSKRPLLNGVASSIAFVVPLHDQEEANLVKKHPPKRLLKLEEQQTSPPVLTHKMLQDKLAEAEQRRMQILNERKESAKILMRPKCANGNTKSVDESVSGIYFTDVASILDLPQEDSNMPLIVAGNFNINFSSSSGEILIDWLWDEFNLIYSNANDTLTTTNNTAIDGIFIER